VYYKPSTKWWDGYKGQRIVLIDDFELNGIGYLGHYLKLWADPYGKLDGEVKGGTVILSFERLFITSNYTIRQCV